MKAIELRETYADTLLRKGYLKLPEHQVVNNNGEGPYFNGSALTPNLGYFLGTTPRPANTMFTQQRVYWTRYADMTLPSPIYTLFQVMMSYYQFEQHSLESALSLGFEMLTDVLGISKHDVYVLVPEQGDFAHLARRAGALDANIVTWKQLIHFQVEDQLQGFYCKMLVKHKHGLLPILDLVHITGADGTLMVDSCMLLERASFLLQNKQTWFETEVFLPLMQAIEATEGSRVFTERFVYPYASMVRSLVAVLADGADVTGKGKGYVIKKTLRQVLQDRMRHGFEAPMTPLVRPALTCLANIGYDWRESADMIEELFCTEEAAFRKWHAGAERFLQKQAQLLVQGRRQPITVDDLANWKDSRGVPFEMADRFFEEQGVAIAGYERVKPHIKVTFADAYPFEIDPPISDARQWLQDFEFRRE